MRLVAVYINDNFLYKVPQTINFGGQYFYEFDNKDFVISRRRNEKFIENFYSEKVIDLVSAVVGRNGCGKTTLLKNIIHSIKNRDNYNCHLIYENQERTFFRSSGIKFTHKFKCVALNSKIQTLYYSPFIDYKDSVHGIDLSFDSIVEKDLNEINDIYHTNREADPVRILKLKNWFRQIDFISSDYANDLRKDFQFPDFNINKITFTRYKIDVSDNKINFHNTPTEFNSILQLIYEKIRQEADLINKKRSAGFQKHLLVNYVLMDIFCLLITQLEKENRYLNEGKIDISLKEFNLSYGPEEAFWEFLKSHYYMIDDHKIKLLPFESTKLIFQKIKEYILKTEKLDWSGKSIYLDKDKTKIILFEQNLFLDEVNNYYITAKNKKNDFIFSKESRINGFINFEPSDRSLSSGESALLNLYSRVYDYFKRSYIPQRKPRKPSFCILFLDEADLGFHPQWKKKFVNSIVNFFKTFFEDLNIDIQIIFSTHDPLTLSDIPNYNVVYLNKSNNEEYSILNELDELRPKKSFGANITDLLADSFFIEDGLIGDFAKEKIKDIISWIEEKDNKVNAETFMLKISIIDEPIVQRKLAEMYDEKMNGNIRISVIDKQIKELNELKNKIENDIHKSK
jgi:ABC-type oligopeptide transport system ATPase subunit